MLMTEAVIETRRVAEARRDSKGRREPFPRADNDAARHCANGTSGSPAGSWPGVPADRRLGPAGLGVRESIWKSRADWTKTLDELAAEQGKPWTNSPDGPKFS